MICLSPCGDLLDVNCPAGDVGKLLTSRRESYG
jgi:hypothetical protein